MTTFTLNEAHKGLEVSFTEKPDRATLDRLKASGFRWHNARRIWYARQTADRLALVRDICGADAETAAAPTGSTEEPEKARSARSADFPGKATSADLERYFKAVSDAENGSQRWIDYHKKQLLLLAVLPNGDFLPIDKRPIETRFCFGESGYDADEASAQAQTARTSEAYFKRENLKPFADMINELETGDFVPYLTTKYWSGKADEIKSLHFCRTSEVCESFGGSCFLAEIGGKEVTYQGQKRRYLTEEEKAVIVSAYKEALKKHEKKVDAYLKRYGLSKVYSWTYWRDA